MPLPAGNGSHTPRVSGPGPRCRHQPTGERRATLGKIRNPHHRSYRALRAWSCVTPRAGHVAFTDVDVHRRASIEGLARSAGLGLAVGRLSSQPSPGGVGLDRPSGGCSAPLVPSGGIARWPACGSGGEHGALQGLPTRLRFGWAGSVIVADRRRYGRVLAVIQLFLQRVRMLSICIQSFHWAGYGVIPCCSGLFFSEVFPVGVCLWGRGRRALGWLGGRYLCDLIGLVPRPRCWAGSRVQADGAPLYATARSTGASSHAAPRPPAAPANERAPMSEPPQLTTPACPTRWPSS